MKSFRKILCAALCLAMAFALCACGEQTNDKAKKADEGSQIANPVRGSSDEEFRSAGVTMPEVSGKTPVYTIIDGDEPLYQCDYGAFTVRAQKTGEQTDISGMSYEWKDEDFTTLELLQGDPIFKTDGNGAGIVYWYINGFSWSVGMTEGADKATLLELYYSVCDANPGNAKPVVG